MVAAAVEVAEKVWRGTCKREGGRSSKKEVELVTAEKVRGDEIAEKEWVMEQQRY